ncbi:hypothetical protein V8B97DRAFT_1917890 [Scleroderma yunnanense]
MYDGEVHTLHAKNGMQLRSKGTGMMIGAANVDPSHKFFIIDNATISFSLHHMGDATYIKTYAIATLEIWLGENSNSKKASSSNDHDNTITIWKKSIKPSPGNRTCAMIWTASQMAMQLLVIAIVGVILYCTMVLAQELAAKLSMDDRNEILNAAMKEQLISVHQDTTGDTGAWTIAVTTGRQTESRKNVMIRDNAL